MTAAEADSVDILALLLNRDWVDVEHCNELDKARLLHVASEHGRLEVVQLLLLVSDSMQTMIPLRPRTLPGRLGKEIGVYKLKLVM